MHHPTGVRPQNEGTKGSAAECALTTMELWNTIIAMGIDVLLLQELYTCNSIPGQVCSCNHG